jgi:outer membrane protein TolC
MRRYITFAVIFFCLLLQQAVSEEQRLSLHDAIKTALGNNDDVKAFESSVSAKKAEIGISRSFLLPHINLDESFVRTNNPTGVFSIKLNQERFTESDFELQNLNNPDPVSDFQTNVSIEQPILAIPELLSIKASKKDYLARSEAFARQKELIAFKVIDSYIRVQTAKEFLGVSEKALEDAREQLRIADKRYNSGLGLYSDTLRASTAVTEAEQQIVSTQKNLKVAKRTLGLLLGLSESVDTDKEQSEIPLYDMEYYTDSSLDRKDIKSLELKHENATTNVQIAEAGFIPKIGVRGTYQLNDSDTPFGNQGNSWFIAGFMRWEIFNGTRRGYQRAQAKHRAAEIEQMLDGLQKKVSLRVYESHLAVDETKKNIELAEATLKTAEEGTRLVQKRYENSLSPFVDLLDAQVNLDRARANLVAKKNEYRISVARLSFESGTIFQDLGIEPR